MESPQKIIIVMSHGKNRPDLLITPINIARVAAAIEVEVKLVFTGNGGELLHQDIAPQLRSKPEEPTFLETLTKIRKEGVQVYVCSPVLEYFGWSKEDFVKEIDGFVGGMFLISESLEALETSTFTEYCPFLTVDC